MNLPTTLPNLPENKAVKDLFEGLLGRDVTLSPGPKVDAGDAPGPITAVYVDDRNAMTSLVLVDFPLTAYVGAALGLVPKGGADAAVEDGELSPALVENTSEVLNVLAAVLGDASGVHERLYATYVSGDARPTDVAAWERALTPRRDLLVEVKGYGSGALSIVQTLS